MRFSPISVFLSPIPVYLSPIPVCLSPIPARLSPPSFSGVKPFADFRMCVCVCVCDVTPLYV